MLEVFRAHLGEETVLGFQRKRSCGSSTNIDTSVPAVMVSS